MSDLLRFAVLGDPIEHSLSPVIQTAALDHAGIAGSYVKVRAGEEELRVAVAGLLSGRWDGLNLTMPLKGLAFEISDALTKEASLSKSVNTLRRREDRVEGHSTDVVATRTALQQPGFGPSDPVLVLGAGGAARAVLAGKSGRTAYLTARDPARAEALRTSLQDEVSVVPWGTAVAGAIVINATPIGMHGEGMPARILSVAAGLIDLAYGAGDTPAVAQARLTGLPVVDGIEFLVLQAAASFEWWTGAPAPIEVMTSAARNI
ncbi:MAG: shikimate dehydrogenase [Acidimicrobiia bacterium]